MKQVVGIIGNKGKYGVVFQQLFSDYDCEIIGADAKDGPGVDERNRAVVEQAQVVMFSVPPREVVGVIDSLIGNSRPDQLWMDITSIKIAPVSAMLMSEAEVVGLHPMCAPTSMFLRGQKVVVCPARLNHWQCWVSDFLKWTGAKIKVCSPEKHDRAMAVVQGLVHAMQLTMAATIRSLGQDIHESLDFTSPVYRIALSLIGRILKQDAALYADIQMLNPNVQEVLSQAATELDNLLEIVRMQDQIRFTEQFVQNKNYFGANDLEDAFNLFGELNQLLADRSSEHQTLLKIKNQDRPGLLHAITGIFAEVGINLTHIHSFRGEEGYRFLVGFDRPVNDLLVQMAIGKIAETGLALPVK